MLECFSDNLGKYLAPSEYLSLDETLHLMHHQITFRQYNTKRSNHYGLLLNALNNAHYPYKYKSILYASKPDSGNGPFGINSTIDYVKNLDTKTNGQKICMMDISQLITYIIVSH